MVILGCEPARAQSVSIDDTETVPGTHASPWTISGNLTIGSSGTGTLDISNGATVSDSLGTLGFMGGSSGTVTVDGTGSIWTNSGELYVGSSGTGALTISNGGTVSDTNAYIAWNFGTTATAVVDGPGSTWSNSGTLYAGSSGTGTLTISNGGTVTDATAYIGFTGTDTGTVIVTGSGSSWATSGDLYVGYAAPGVLTISNGGTVSAGGTVFIANQAGSTGTLNIGAAAGSAPVAPGTLSASSIVFGAGTGTIVFNHTDTNYTFGANISGAGSVDVEAGTTILSGTNSYTGGTTVNGGTLAFGVAGTLGLGALTINGGTLVLADTATTTISSLSGSGGSIQSHVSNLTINQSSTTSYEGTISTTGSTFIEKNGNGSLTLNGTISGSIVIVQSAGTLALNGNNSFIEIDLAGGTTVAGSNTALGSGDVEVSNAPTLTSNKTVSLSNEIDLGSGSLTVGGAYDMALTGMITGTPGQIIKTGIDTLTLSGANTFTGGTQLQQGGLRLGSNSALGAGTLTASAGTAISYADGVNIGNAIVLSGTTTFTVDGTDSATQSGAMGGAGSLVKTGSGTLTLLGQANYAGGTDVEAGTLVLGANSALSSLTINGGKFALSSSSEVFTPTISGSASSTIELDTGSNLFLQDSGASIASSYSGTITGAGEFSKATAADLTLSGNNSYSGGTDVSEGTLHLQSNAALGTGFVNLSSATLDFADGLTVANAIQLFGAGSINVDGSRTATLSGVITDHGGAGINLTKTGTGTLILTGDSSAAADPVFVNQGVLSVNGKLGGPVTVQTGGTLGGSGTLTGNVTVADGTIAPSGSSSSSPRTLTINGNLTLAASSTVSFQLGSPTGVAGVNSDLINVGGNLTLDGTLNVSDAGGFGAGVYRLINYGGTLTDNGLALGTLPSGVSPGDLTIQTAVAGQVNLLSTYPGVTLGFWDGAGAQNDNAISGGSGTWSASSTNWTDATGATNGTYNTSSLLVFQGAPGTITVDDTAGPVSASSLQFAVDGYMLTGGDLTLNGSATIRVGDGTAAGAGYTATIADNLIGNASLTKTDLGTLILSGTNSYSNGTTISGGTLQLGAGGTTGSIIGDVTDNGTLAFNRSNSYAFAGNISGGGGVNQIGSGTTTLSGTNSYSGGTMVTAGTLQAGSASAFGTNSAVTVASGATLDLAGFSNAIGSLAGGGTVTSGVAGGATLTTGGDNTSTSFSGSIQDGLGVVTLTKTGAGALTLTGASSYSGGTTLTAGSLVIGNDNALGSGDLSMAAGTTLAFLGSGNFTLANNIAISGDPTFSVASGTVQTISGVIADGGSPGTLEKEGAGTLVLSATNSYTGATNINAGTLEVDGSIASSSLTTVNSGAALSGVGTVGATQINAGGILLPGNSAGGTLTVSGNLTMNSSSFYAVQISPTQSARTQVNGTATLNGATVVVTPQLGTYAAHTYTILTATNALSDQFNSAVMVTRDGVISKPTLSYDANNAYLSVQAYTSLVDLPGSPGSSQEGSGASQGSASNDTTTGVSSNAQNVAAALNNFILAGGTVPDGYQNLSGLSGAALVNAVNQLAGQAAPSFTSVGFTAGTMFLDLMLNPYTEGRSQGAGGFGPGFMAYAPDSSTTDNAATIFGRFDGSALKASFQPHYSIWAAAYGGTGSISGNAMTGAVGSNAGIYGLAAGLDYHVTPDTVIGFALGGGATNWTLSQGFGGGHSGMAQAGVYATQRFGRAYLSGALAYSWQDVSASRLVTLAGPDTLNSNFGANTVSGRLEAGYRLPVDHLAVGVPQGRFGVTPYGALQAQGMFLPSYAEYASAGSSAEFALRYASRDYSVVRTEVGAWFDYALDGTDHRLTLYSRAAFAHDFENEGIAVAAFQQLPGSSFLINAAKPAANGALVTEGLEYRLADGWSVLGKFDGEFSSTTSIYAGTGTLRKSW